jgi:hypothetical protein
LRAIKFQSLRIYAAYLRLQNKNICMPTKPVKKLFSEPLVQFLIIGAAIFLIDSVITDSRKDNSKIVINDARLSELTSIFMEGQGREPSPIEVDNMIIKWAQNEVLFREAKKMGLDQGDEMIRSRLVLKMQNVLFNSVSVEVPPDAQLKAWFEEYKEDYDIPAKYTVEQFYFAADNPDALEEAEALTTTIGSADVPPDYEQQLRRYPSRPKASLKNLFNDNGLQNLLKSNINQWQVVSSKKGLHLARVTKLEPAKQADFYAIKRQVIKDWKRYSKDLQLMQQTTEIANRYTIDIITKRVAKERQNGQSETETLGI